MKRKYEKPIVYFESFELNTSVCGSCGGGVNSAGFMGGKPGFATPDACAWEDIEGKPIMFLAGSSVCAGGVTFTEDDDADGMVYCYNKPSESGLAVFSS